MAKSIPRIIRVEGKRVVFEVETTQEQREKVLMHYATEKADRLKAASKNPLFHEVKNFLRIYKEEIIHDPSNAHLTREVQR